MMCRAAFRCRAVRHALRMDPRYALVHDPAYARAMGWSEEERDREVRKLRAQQRMDDALFGEWCNSTRRDGGCS